MFFFQSMFQQVYSGITGSNTLNAVTTIAQGILLLTALFGVYEAYSRGGDVHSLALVGVRFLFMGLLLTQYPAVFGTVNNAAANLAQQISPIDVFTTFKNQAGTNLAGAPWGTSAWYKIIPGGVAAAFSLLVQLIAVIVFPVTMVLFSFFYSMYGAMLYVVGPLVLALYPAFGIGQLARTYMVNLLIWNSWGILYAVMSQLLNLMTAGSLTSILTAQSFGGAFQGASQMMLLSLSSILLSLMIALIPVIAKRVVSGDVGSTMFTAISAATTALAAVGAGLSAFGGAMAGGGGTGPKDPPDPPGPPPGGEGNLTSNTASANSSSSTAPQGPSDSTATGGGGVRVREKSASGGGGGDDPPCGGGGGGGGSNPPAGGRNSGGYPIGLGPRNVLQSGLYAMPAMVGWATGKTARAISNRFNSSNEEA
jgi:hypothetical protein